MPWHNQQEGFERINQLGASKTPFLFIVSYDKNQIFAQPLDLLDKEILYHLNSHSNTSLETTPPPPSLATSPLSFATYKRAFDQILDHIAQGNSYLLNLTFKTPITTNATLKEIFARASTPYRLYYNDQFVCFSPESFIQIEGNTISTYPMKGTIDASLPHAKEQILSNTKEMAEHVMITDLMRNDLGIIGSHVAVERFRYVEEIDAGAKRLLQVSSKITASLSPSWHTRIGTLLCNILPAGSITGTPKRKTVEIIEQVEHAPRGFYTGIFGIFDGERLDSSVMIRFISKEEEQLYYHSGGGITIDSNAPSEYQELLDKIYLP
jgi:para-aminobenzoate synthetase component 1